MNPKSQKVQISKRQFTILIILGTVGDSILVMPTVIAGFAKQNAWISSLVALLAGLLAGLLFAAVANKLRRQHLIKAVQQRIGIWFGGIVGLLLLVEFYMCSLTLLSETSQFLNTQLMPETPVSSFIVIFLAVIVIAFRYGIETFARMSELLFPLFLLLFFAVIILLLPQIKMDNLLPIASDGFLPILHGSFPAFAAGFTEMIILLMLVPHVEGEEKLTKSILIGFLTGGAVLFIIVLLCVLALGSNLMESKLYPTFVLGQKIMIGHFLERVEAIIAFLWLTTVFFKSLLIFYSMTKSIAHILRLKEDHFLTIPLCLILVPSTIAVMPNTAVYNDILANEYQWFDMTFCIGLPMLILAILYLPVKASKKAAN
ncbi:endospore germination permease [Paenibacillus sp. HB172176]|uniref:GerAB/ArcD/ProY family transporter n=1 Tax=Paenibacillus sp. HB172176 TaxID=2493690 RepID=UPI00143C87A1|nr:endospore germination permease [Paenibacillus sp. HB172176]